MQKTILFFFFLFLSPFAHAQIQTPQQFLGYPLGEAFTLHADLNRYIQHLASQSPRLKIQEYGKTYEKRSLQVVFVSAPENLAKLDEIRQNNLKHAGLLEGGINGLQLPIVWLAYTVHGNEPAGTEASMALLHQLATDNSEKVQNWLKDLLIVIDPCQNPDGRERYAHWYQTVQNTQKDVNPDGWEHIEPWARGRFNHYMYDLNRDWAWQTQVETQQRTNLYRQWLPQVHIDVHEMGYEQSYFFGPPAHPIHPFASKWQREFSETIAQGNKQNFDNRQEPYFTKETYDFFYPSYGDTYPSLHGAIGLTYEQGGIRGGLGIVRSAGDTLYFTKRVQNHWEASQNTIATVLKEKEKLLQNFKQFFQENLQNPDSKYKTYIIKHHNSVGKLRKLVEFLERNYVQVGKAGKTGKFKGYAYHKNQETDLSLEAEDLIITAYQPQARLLNVLLEPEAILEDSLTYDLTAWALPYAYGLEAFALKEKILPTQKIEAKQLGINANSNSPSPTAFAYLVPWQDFENVRFLTKAITNGIKIRQAINSFERNKTSYPAGTLVILRSDNKNLKDFDQKLFEVAKQTQQVVTALPTGAVDKGNDLGSEYYIPLKNPKIGIVGGDGTDATEFGAVWHHFERDLEYPVTVIQHEILSNIDLEKYDVLVLPTGRYNAHTEKLTEYAKQGGKIIALDNALHFTAYKGTTSAMGQRLMKLQEERTEIEQTTKTLERYEYRERSFLTESTAGAICKIKLDNTHPLAYGLGKTYYSLRLNQKHYPLLPKGHWNVGVYDEKPLVSGFVGKVMLSKIPNTFAFGVENMGRGKVIYLPETPVFRGFWYNGKMLFANAVFSVR
jgi:hypothetical protein